MTPAYFNKVRPTYLENWSAALANLSIEQTDIPLSLTEARALGLANKKFKGWFGGEDGRVTPALAQIAEKIEDSLRKYPAGAFVRLGSRSAKDSTYAYIHGARIEDAAAAVKTLTSDSQRIAFDLRLALKHDYRPHIFVRRWMDIPAWAEFRCFMRDRKLVGISQYDCKNLGRCLEIAEHANQLRTAIESFSEKISAASHLDDVVFDVFVEIKERRQPSVKVTLLELNPFFPQTDACLFSWRDNGDFDGSFRFV